MMNAPIPATPDKVNLSLGTRIRTLRTARNMKITDLAQLTGLNSSTISQLERALLSPSIASLKKICDALEIPLGYLFEESDEPEAQPVIPPSPGAAPVVQPMDPQQIMSMLPPVNLGGLSPVVHRENRKLLSPGKGIRFYLLNPNMSGPIEMIYNEYDPGASTGPALYSHPGSECGVILSGELFVQIKDKEYILKEGDSLTFNSSDPHLKRNDSDRMCTCIWANVPPWF